MDKLGTCLQIVPKSPIQPNESSFQLNIGQSRYLPLIFLFAVDSPIGNLYYLNMYVDDFIWLPNTIDKLLVKHHVSPDEVEEVFFNKPHFRFVEKGLYSGEDVYAGQTEAGRYLVVFFIKKANNLALILSARDMNRRERKSYGKK